MPCRHSPGTLSLSLSVWDCVGGDMCAGARADPHQLQPVPQSRTLQILSPATYQIVISAHSARSDSGPCLLSHVSSSCVSVLDSPLYYSIGFPSGPAYPVPTPLTPASASAPGFLQSTRASPGLHSIFPLCFNKCLYYFIPVPSSESALGFPCSTPRNTMMERTVSCPC